VIRTGAITAQVQSADDLAALVKRDTTAESYDPSIGSAQAFILFRIGLKGFELLRP
jgi:hypothetical protein